LREGALIKSSMNMDPHRAGRYVRQTAEYSAFIPAPLPPEPPLEMDAEVTRLLSEADLALGRLDGASMMLPNADLFVAMYVRREAVLSSQIEGTQASLTDVLQFEAGGDGGETERLLDVEEVVNYVRATNYGLRRLEDLPLSLRLIREIHGELMRGVRGEESTPGEFRHSQNWIGPRGSTLRDARFVPPPQHELLRVLGEWELFLHARSEPVLITAALAHAQFETIHPFLDGNGRVGRLLIALLLYERKVLARPLLYLSLYLKRNQTEYYDRLQAVREKGDWEAWVRFFLEGVRSSADESTETTRRILTLREEDRVRLAGEGRMSGNLLRALDHLFAQPVTTPQLLASALGIQYVTANNLVARLVDLGVLAEMTGYRRNRRFAYRKYLDMFEEETAPGLTPADGTLGAGVEDTTVSEPPAETAHQVEAAEWVGREDSDALRKLAE
jgi:Fic family protein